MSRKVTRKIKSWMLGVAMLVLVCGCMTGNAHAETPGAGSTGPDNYACGSYNLMKDIGDNQHRPYLDYFAQLGTGDTGISGVLRRNIMKAYLMPGETLYLGSSVCNTRFDINGNLTSKVTGCDIVVIAPDGTRTALDVIQNGAGYMANPAAETKGPTIPGLHENGGYQAIPYKAEKEGVYEILFQSVNGDASNPVSKKKSDNSWTQNNSTIAAWNATVIGADQTYKSGRVYTKMLALNMGSQAAEFASPLYVQTADGYIYKMKCRDALPWGFVFYANNRGLVDIETDYNLYRSYRYDSKTLRDLGVDFHNPNTPDTKENITFNIFFEEPSPELIGKVYPKAYAPSSATNFRFFGTEAEDRTHTGCGGYFAFDTTNASSATVKIDMTAIGGGVVEISNVVAPGNNKFYWDGLDENGRIVPIGEYDSDQIKVSVTTYAGDYHFPMLDVEALPNGITIERINPIYQEVVEDGNIVEKDVTADYDADRYRIYYNNPSNVADGVDASAGVNSADGALRFGSTSNYNLGNNTAVNIWTYASGDHTTVYLDKPISIVNETDHTNMIGRVFFDTNKDGLYDHANQDYVLTDIPVTLTYYEKEGDEWVQKTMEDVTDAGGKYHFFGIPLDPDGTHPATLTVAKDAAYTITTENTSTNSKVTVCTDAGTKAQEAAGSKYQTNGTATQTMQLGQESRYIPELRFSDVGINYGVSENPLVVRKNWTEDIADDPNQPDSVTVYAEKYYEKDGQHIQAWTASYQLNKSNFWQYTDYSIPEKITDTDGQTHDLKIRFIKEVYTTRDGQSYTYEFKDDGDYTGQANPYATFMSPMVKEGKQNVYTVTNSLKNKTLKVKKVDAADDSKALSGAEMTLWNLTVLTKLPDGIDTANPAGTIGSDSVYKLGTVEYLVDNGKIYVKSATATTGDDGMATFPNSLPANSYIITESGAPTGYYLSTTLYPVTLQAGDTGKTVTVTNEKMPMAQFDLDGGTGTANAISAASGSKISLPAAPTRKHYAFKGWKTGETTYDAGAEYELTADVTFTAQWEQVSTDPEVITPKAAVYRVEYYKENLDGTYSLVADDTQMLMDEIGTEVTAPAKTYTDYTERTTPDESKGTVVVPTTDDAGAPVILVLKRYYNRNTYTVSFDKNGGTGTADDRTEKYGTTIQLPAAPTKNHFEFKGWKVGETTYPAGADYEVTGTVTLTAQWEQVSTDPEVITPKAAAYRVEYYQQNLDGTYDLVAEDSQLLMDEIGKEVTAPEKTYPHFTERTEPDESTGTIVAPTTDDDGELVILVLKRYYNRDSYTTSFEANGGDEAPEAQSNPYGTTLQLPNAPTKEGYTFAGWKLGDVIYPAGADYEVSGDITFTAQWTPIPEKPGTSDNSGGSGSGTTINGGSKPSANGTPDTGDHGTVTLWLGILGLCSVMLLRMRKKSQENR